MSDRLGETIRSYYQARGTHLGRDAMVCDPWDESDVAEVLRLRAEHLAATITEADMFGYWGDEDAGRSRAHAALAETCLALDAFRSRPQGTTMTDALDAARRRLSDA